MRRILFALASGYLLYLACVNRGDAAEWAVGAVAAALAALISALALGRPESAQALRSVPWLRYGSAILRCTIHETFLVLAGVARALIGNRPLRGRFLCIPVDPGGEAPEDRLRRALILWGMAVSPNDYAVSIDGANRSLLTHRLIPDERPPGRGERVWPA